MKVMKVVAVLIVVAIASAAMTRAFAGDGKLEVTGAGLIGDPIPDVTIPSPSDFGFVATEQGGNFLCSMAGPLTGGFSGFEAMLVEGRVMPETLEVSEGTATFLADVTVVIVKENDLTRAMVVGARPGPYVRIKVTVEEGEPGEGTLVLSDPDGKPLLGLPGLTGGYVEQGFITIEGK